MQYSLVVNHEVRSLIRASAFVWILLLLAAAMAFGAWAGARHLQRAAQSVQAVVNDASAIREKLRSDLAAYEQRMEKTGG